jgi:type II secretory pathway pseudopilin PulG
MELLVVLVLMVIVTGAGFTLFQIGARHEARQQDMMAQTQNLRAALYTLARDVRMAGNGLAFIGGKRLDIYVDIYAPPEWETPGTDPGPGWFKYTDALKFGARAVYGTNGTPGDPDAPDTLTVFRAEIENPLPLGHLAAGFNPGLAITPLLTLRDSVKEGVNLADGDILAVASGERVVIVQAKLAANAVTTTLNLGPRFQPGAPLPDGYIFPAGSTVYNLRDIVLVTYYLDRGPDYNRLMANYHDDTVSAPDDAGTNSPSLVAVSGNIEDLQVRYYISKAGDAGPALDADGVLDVAGLTPDINEAVLDTDGGRDVRLVSLALKARTSRTSEVAGTSDNYNRQVLTEDVSLRNFNPY